MARTSSPKYKRLVTQSILVPKKHPDVVKHGLAGAKAVARRHGDQVGIVDSKMPNFYTFRQLDPDLMEKGTIVTRKEGRGILIRSGRLTSSAGGRELKRQGAGVCAVGAKRKRVVCAERYTGHGLEARTRTTKVEHEKMPAEASPRELIPRMQRTLILHPLHEGGMTAIGARWGWRYGVRRNVGDTGRAERLVLIATSVFKRTKISLVFFDFSLGTQ